MFTPAQIQSIARRAHHATEGKREGHTVYASKSTARRYIVGGYRPSAMVPVGAPVAVVRAAVGRMTRSAGEAETLGYREDDGTLYLDLGNTFSSLSMALHVAERRGELAIYDREMNAALTVEGARGTMGSAA